MPSRTQAQGRPCFPSAPFLIFITLTLITVACHKVTATKQSADPNTTDTEAHCEKCISSSSRASFLRAVTNPPAPSRPEQSFEIESLNKEIPANP